MFVNNYNLHYFIAQPIERDWLDDLKEFIQAIFNHIFRSPEAEYDFRPLQYLTLREKQEFDRLFRWVGIDLQFNQK